MDYKIWTISALSERWGVARDKLRKWINSGELRAFNVASRGNGRPRWRITQAAVDEFLSGRSNLHPEQSEPALLEASR